MAHATSSPRPTAEDHGQRNAEWEELGSVCRALGSPLRVGIVVLLQERSRSVNELVEALAVSQPLVSQHLRVLRSAGLVAGARNGREMIYATTSDAVFDLVARAGRQLRQPRPSLRVAR